VRRARKGIVAEQKLARIAGMTHHTFVKYLDGQVISRCGIPLKVGHSSLYFSLISSVP
jgi:hypothetical protein